jgi:nucleoside-diphosphate-sugar epimerase
MRTESQRKFAIGDAVECTFIDSMTCGVVTGIQPWPSPDVQRAQHLFGFRAHTRLEDGLKLTIDLYRCESKVRQ